MSAAFHEGARDYTVGIRENPYLPHEKGFDEWAAGWFCSLGVEYTLDKLEKANTSTK
mgnify:CR=1 FL=1